MTIGFSISHALDESATYIFSVICRGVMMMFVWRAANGAAAAAVRAVVA